MLFTNLLHYILPKFYYSINYFTLSNRMNKMICLIAISLIIIAAQSQSCPS